MTTTAHEDQFTTATQTIERVRAPYDTAAILRRNIADMEVALRTQMERAEAAEAELAKLAQQKPVATLALSYYGSDFEMFYDIKDLKFDNGWMRLYASPVPAPAVPNLVGSHQIEAPDCRTCANRGRANWLSQESFCDSCVWQGMSFRKNHFVDAAADRLLEDGE